MQLFFVYIYLKYLPSQKDKTNVLNFIGEFVNSFSSFRNSIENLEHFVNEMHSLLKNKNLPDIIFDSFFYFQYKRKNNHYFRIITPPPDTSC